jgi:hypothetical protein
MMVIGNQKMGVLQIVRLREDMNVEGRMDWIIVI